VSAFDRVYTYVPRKPEDDLVLTGLLLSSLSVAIFYLLLWWLDPAGADAYGGALDSIGLILLSVGFFGFLILRALDQLQPKYAVPGPGVHPANSPLMVYSASYALTAATLALAALGSDLAGVSVLARFLDLFVTLFVWTLVYIHISQLGENREQPILRLFTLRRWRPVVE
jgi:hypothetical protein